MSPVSLDKSGPVKPRSLVFPPPAGSSCPNDGGPGFFFLAAGKAIANQLLMGLIGR